MQVLVKKLHDDAMLPTYAHEDDAGADIYAYILGEEQAYGERTPHTITISPHESRIIPTGLIFQIPKGYVGSARPRSGLAFKHDVTLSNSPGTIDAGYRGEVMVKLINHGEKPITISHGDRIAQILIEKVNKAEYIAVDELDITERGSGGFGSSGR